ncbi:hypothetical protein N9X70_00150 [Gammaproteobacteria bacterium]|nr:hypothetical protein [Gammaproteobacteria bacterium]
MASCGSKDSNDEIKLSSLIQPNFSFTYDLIECELNKNSSLLDLEFFFSKNIDKYKAITDGKIRLSILFPENKINVSGFIIAIKSNTDYGNLESFISQIQRDQFNDIALCKFITNQNKGFNILEYKNNSNLDYEFVEILTCQYKEGYNYGSFEITINRFLNYIQKLDIPYSLNYVNKSKNNEFIWINSFHNNDYKQILIDSWVMENEAIEIKDEFIENASCIESDTFKSYHLL